MDHAVWKYPLDVVARQMIHVPAGGVFLSVGVQNEYPVLWALVDPSEPVKPRLLTLVTTGQKFDASGLRFIGTATIKDWFVAHIFEGAGPRSTDKDDDLLEVAAELQRDAEESPLLVAA